MERERQKLEKEKAVEQRRVLDIFAETLEGKNAQAYSTNRDKFTPFTTMCGNAAKTNNSY